MWCVWLLGSWSLTIGLEAPIPAVSRMIFASVIGMMVLWPAWRLSQHRTQRPVGAGRDHGSTSTSNDSIVAQEGYQVPQVGPGVIFRDWLSLNLVFQAVIWPLKISAQWGLGQTLWLDAAIASWSLLTAALVAWGSLATHGGKRTVAMALCLLVILGEPLVMGLMNLGNSGITWQLRISPLYALSVLAGKPWSWTAAMWPAQIISVALAAMIGWLIVVWHVRRHHLV